MEWIEKRELLEDLFIHRRDAIAVYKNGHWMGRAKSWTKTANGRNEIEEYQSYKPENGDAILYHHAEVGSERMGVYPHALDNTTKTIAADFDDKQKTNEELFATCLSLKQVLCSNDIQAYIERSHSGFGFHVWIFFEKPIDCELATKVMVEAFKQVGLPMVFGTNGYDRLFPCVTKVGKSKFAKKPWVGNTIGLPLQATAAAKGNCVFLDDSAMVIQDQWNLLKNIQKVSVQTILDFTRNTIHIQPKKASKTIANRETSGWQYWQALSHVEGQFDRMKECEAIKEHILRPNHFDNRQWALGIMGNLAVFTANDELHDDVVKFAYDIEKEYVATTGIEDTTEQTLMARKDHLQQGEYPMSCKEMFAAGSGWKCPKLETCPYNFIAKYDAPPSLTVYSTEKSLTIEDRVKLNQLEQQGLYEEFRKILPWAGKISDYRIARHLIGIRPLDVYTFDFKEDTVKSIFQEFEDKEQLEKFKAILESRKGIKYCTSENNEMWLIDQQTRHRPQAVQLMMYLVQQLNGELQIEISLEKNDMNLSNRYEAIAPFFGQLREFALYFEGGKGNES